jgi:hypothetical protein
MEQNIQQHIRVHIPGSWSMMEVFIVSQRVQKNYVGSSQSKNLVKLNYDPNCFLF